MHCQEAERGELAERYLRGVLEPEAQDGFEVHFLECKSCQHVLEALHAAREGLNQRAEEIRTLPATSGIGWLVPVVVGVVVLTCVTGATVYLRHRHARHGGTSMTAPQGVTASIPAKDQTPQASTPSKPAESSGKSSATPKASSLAKSAGKSQTKAILATPKAAPETANSAANTSNPSGGLAPFTPGAAAKAEERNDVIEAELRQLEVFQAPQYAPPNTASGKPQPKVFEGSGTVEESAPRTGDWTRPDFQQAMFAYSDGRYWSAIALLEDDLKMEPLAADANFYLGACYLMVGRIPDAIAPLKVAADDKKSPLRQSAHFYLAKVYIRTRQVAEAESEMQAAAALPGPLKTEAASELARLKALPTP